MDVSSLLSLATAAGGAWNQTEPSDPSAPQHVGPSRTLVHLPPAPFLLGPWWVAFRKGLDMEKLSSLNYQSRELPGRTLFCPFRTRTAVVPQVPGLQETRGLFLELLMAAV